MNKTSFYQTPAFAIVSFMLVVSGIGTSLYFFQEGKQSQHQLEQEMLSHEVTLGERIELAKEMQTLNELLEQMKGTNQLLDTKVLQLQSILNQRESRISSLQRYESDSKRLQKEIADLRTLRETLERELQQGHGQISTLTQALQSAQAEQNRLTDELAAWKSRATANTQEQLPTIELAADRMMMTSHRARKNKLTLVAARTHTMILSCQLDPPILQDGEDVSVILTLPDGNRLFLSSDLLDVVLVPVHTGHTPLQEMFLTFYPEQKLRSGIYSAQILIKNDPIGTIGFAMK